MRLHLLFERLSSMGDLVLTRQEFRTRESVTASLVSKCLLMRGWPNLAPETMLKLFAKVCIGVSGRATKVGALGGYRCDTAKVVSGSLKSLQSR
jgi:hypothetical protein